MKTILSLIILILGLSPLFLTAQPDWEKHGQLEVSKNGHYVQHKDGTPFLWIGDTAWGMFQQLTREEVDQYLDNRQKLGFTVIQSVAFWYPHGGGIESGPHNAANVYGYKPFTGDFDNPNTSEPLITTGGSGIDPNDYWDHVDYITDAIKKRGMYLALLPCWGRAYITQQFGGSHNEFSKEEAQSYGAFLGNRFKNEPNIIYILGGDAKAQTATYDKRAIFRSMAEGILKGRTGETVAWNQDHPVWNQIFMTYHPDGDAPLNSSNWFHEDKWLTANGVEVWKTVDLVYQTMLREYQLESPVKPSLFLEGTYEYGSYDHECGWVTPVKVRRQIFHTFFAGGAGHTYGAGPIWPMRGNQGSYSCGYTWEQALHFPGAANFSGVLKNFLKDHNWHKWTPDQSILVGITGEAESLKSAVLSSDENEILVYFSNNSMAIIKNKLSGKATAQWFDPSSGKTKDAGNFQTNKKREMEPPNGWEDAVLVLKMDE